MGMATITTAAIRAASTKATITIRCTAASVFRWSIWNLCDYLNRFWSADAFYRGKLHERRVYTVMLYMIGLDLKPERRGRSHCVKARVACNDADIPGNTRT